MKKQTILLLSLFTIGTATFAQDQTNTIDNQFTSLLSRSNNWQKHKVIPNDEFDKLQRNVHDTINKLQNKINSNASFLKDHKATVDSLSSQLKATQLELDEALKLENSVKVLGIATQKTTFKSLVAIIIGILLLALGLLYYRFKKSYADTKEAKQNLQVTELELEDLRRQSLEREQKIRRQLQDEINKNKNT